MSIPVAPGGRESSEPNDPDGIMSDQDMPTADGQMASNTTEEERPPRAERDDQAGDDETRLDETRDDDVDEVTLDALP